MNRTKNPPPVSPRFAWWCAATILLSAFLLFQVQPVIGKTVLPWFGGSPSVWTTCMLFFQVLLVGGYFYADAMTRWRAARWAAAIHVVLLVLAACFLPITPAVNWKPAGGTEPTRYLLLLLAAHVGLPYFLLATTGPLVQSWFARVYPGRSPYRLYALSNAGSMGALLSYPFLVEPTMSTGWQGRIWSIGFGLFVAVCGGLAIGFARLARRTPPMQVIEGSTSSGDTPAPGSTSDSRAASAQLPNQDSLAKAASRQASRSESAGPKKNEKGNKQRRNESDGRGASRAAEASIEPPTQLRPWVEPAWVTPVSWVALPAVASVALLAITNYLSQDIAVSPLMWVAPLSIYLLTFIICFDHERWYVRRLWAVVAVMAILAVCNLMLSKHTDQVYEFAVPISAWARNITVQASTYLITLFGICMVCHGELVRRKPAPHRLTSFYLSVSVGGALGGIFVGILCPFLFNGSYELHGVMIVGYLISYFVLARDGWKTWLPQKDLYRVLVLLIGLVGLFVVTSAQFNKLQLGARNRARNFYGVLYTQEHYPDDDSWHGLGLYHGTTLHGYQYFKDDKRRTPTTYYQETSGVGVTMKNYPRPTDRGLRVSVVGLGTGTLAAYSRKGDVYTFYEINPIVEEFARRHFTFLSGSEADVSVKLGDARLTLEEESDVPRCDILVLDAFSSDAIPTHLLTREAFELYERRIEPSGVICVHISNRHLDLEPIVERLAREHGWKAVAIHDTPEEAELDSPPMWTAWSTWILVTKNEGFLAIPEVDERCEPVRRDDAIPMWTDQFSNLLQILQ